MVFRTSGYVSHRLPYSHLKRRPPGAGSRCEVDHHDAPRRKPRQGGRPEAAPPTEWGVRLVPLPQWSRCGAGAFWLIAYSGSDELPLGADRQEWCWRVERIQASDVCDRAACIRLPVGRPTLFQTKHVYSGPPFASPSSFRVQTLFQTKHVYVSTAVSRGRNRSLLSVRPTLAENVSWRRSPWVGFV